MRKLLLAATILFLLLVAFIVVYRFDASTDGVQQQARVGLILTGDRQTDGWSMSHFQALSSLSREMDFELLVREGVSEFDDSSRQVIRDMVAAGAEVIVLAGLHYGDTLDTFVGEYPEVCFLHASGTRRGKNLQPFFGKMYQARYLTGLVAGLHTASDRIGYVAAMEVDEVVRGLNAFAIGVRTVNPDATVLVKYTGRWDAPEAEAANARTLLETHGVDVVAYHQNGLTAARIADAAGAYSITYHVANPGDLSERCLTGAVWRWEPFYRERIRDCLYGGPHSRNYWMGIETGIVDIAPLSHGAKPGTADFVGSEKARMTGGNWDVFHGPIRDNRGRLVVEKDASMSDDELIHNFDWYVEGVEVVV